MAEARKMASYQFSMYGMNDVPADVLEYYAQKVLADEQQGRRIVEKVQDDLVLDHIRKTATIEKKKISLEKMRELTN